MAMNTEHFQRIRRELEAKYPQASSNLVWSAMINVEAEALDALGFEVIVEVAEFRRRAEDELRGLLIEMGALWPYPEATLLLAFPDPGASWR